MPLSISNLSRAVGSSGYSGISGYSGFSGQDGTIGVNGTSGYSGFSGVSGYSGFSGAAGAAGPANTVNATDDTSTTTLYPVMVGGAGSNQTPKVTTTKLSFNANTGTVTATVFNATSDMTLKTNIQPIDNVNAILQKIVGVSFDWKDTNTKSYGVIAQNIEKVIPEAVSVLNNVKSVNYNALIAFLIESNKELCNRIEQLEKKLN